MNMRQSFEEGKGKWACIRISRAVEFPDSEMDERDFLTGRILDVCDDYVKFALYDSASQEREGDEPTEVFNLSFSHIVIWDFADY